MEEEWEKALQVRKKETERQSMGAVGTEHKTVQNFKILIFLLREQLLSQLVSEPTRGGTMIDLLFANRDGLVGDVGAGGHLGHSDHKIIKFSIFGETRRGINKTFTLDFQRADFGLCKRLNWRVPWEAALKNKGVQEGWACFKTEILNAQEQMSLCAER